MDRDAMDSTFHGSEQEECDRGWERLLVPGGLLEGDAVSIARLL